MDTPAASESQREAHYDLLVIGAGQGGGPLAGAFARAGRRVALVERVHVGGTCINEGCSPTKTIIASARAAYLARRAGDYGVHPCGGGADDFRVDLARVRERKQQIVDSFRDGSERALMRAGVELVRGQARFVAPRQVEVSTDGTSEGDPDHGSGRRRVLSADVVVINTGLQPAIPSLDGLDRVHYLTSTSIMELTEAPTHLIVLGGGYVGLEFAQAFRRFGSRVTIVQRDRQLLPREDADVAEAVTELLREDGIEVLLSAAVVRVERQANGVRLFSRERPREGEKASTDCSAREIVGSHLLVATGRTPNTRDLGLDAAGVETDARGYIRVNERLETSAPGVYAIGDVKGGPAFTHISYDDFRILRTNLLEGRAATTKDRLVPYTVFIDPQLGAVGMTEQEARAAGHSIRVATLPMTNVARALEVDESRGFMKAIVDDKTQQILGARVLGIEGGEIAAVLQVAMLGKLPYTVLRDAVFSHPTLAEALNNLFTGMEREEKAPVTERSA